MIQDASVESDHPSTTDAPVTLVDTATHEAPTAAAFPIVRHTPRLSDRLRSVQEFPLTDPRARRARGRSAEAAAARGSSGRCTTVSPAITDAG